MVVETLTESPLSPAAEVGPYRKEDYFRLPDEPRCELLFGRFYVSPSPTLSHQAVALALWRRLAEIARGSGGIATAAPLDVTLADHTVVQPDVVYVSHEHLDVARERIEGAPDLVVEVLSPGTVRRDRSEKLRAYAETGVGEYWMVDHASRQIDFLVNREGRFEVALAIDGVYRSDRLPEVRLDLTALWGEVDELLPR